MADDRSSGDPKPLDVDRVMGVIAGILDLAPGEAASNSAMAELGALVRAMAANGHRREEPVRETLTRIGDRWSSLLLFILRAGPFRHAVLRRLVNATAAEEGISQRMLTLRLRVLERDGFVSRKVIPTVPPQVEYALTPLGREFADHIDGIIEWVGRNGARMKRAQAAFDAKSRRQA